ncbi:MAG: hypothetical protein ABI232_04955 [Jatrophihabitantaceae bacterium]
MSDTAEPIEPDYDPQTLHEVYADTAAVQQRISELRSRVPTAPDVTAELLARGDLVDLLRGTGELDDTLTQAQQAADRAEIAGTAAQQHLARLRLAQTHSRRGDFAQSNPLFTELTNSATQFGTVIEGYTAQAAGVNDYDQALYAEAHELFAHALQIRERYELPDEQIAASRQAVAAAAQQLRNAE